MPPAFVIAQKDLRQRFRDRSAIVLGFVAPLAIAMLMSFAFRGASHFHISVDVVDHDHGPLAAAFHDFLDSPELHNVVTVARVTDDEQAAAARVHDANVDAAIVIPQGFSAATTNARASQLAILTSTDTKLGGEVAQAIAAAFVAQVNADRLSVATAISAGVPASRIPQLSRAAAHLRIPESSESRPIGSKPLKAVSYYAPAMAIFFLLFAIGFTARSFFSEQADGMIDRISAAPVHPRTILLGKSLSVLVYGAASIGTVIVITSVFFGADWGNPIGAVTVSLAMIVAVVALTAFVISIARTERQAEGLASIVVFGLALLGGNFVTISAAPPLMRRLALLTPNGWALRGFVDLSTGAHGAHVVVQPLIGIIVFTACVAFIALLASRRTTTR